MVVVISRTVVAIIIAFLTLGKMCVSVEAEQFRPVYDFTTDFYSYAEAVSSYNRTDSVSLMRDKDGNELPVVSSSKASSFYAVIARTNGVELQVDDEDLIFKIKGPENHYMLYYETRQSAAQAVDKLQKKSGILYAELDSEIETVELSLEELNGTYGNEVDKSFTAKSNSFYSWGAERLGFGSYLPYIASWQVSTSTIAVLDSGVYPHDCIISKMPESGYDYVDTDDDATNDENGHGTHVAGIIADCTSSIPVYIYPIRVLSANGSGKMSNFITAISEARIKGVDVINLSLSSRRASEAMDFEIRECVEAGISVVIAAGNNNADTAELHPSNLMDPGIIVVGSVTENNGDITKASYSNYGNSVDVYTFGSNIVSCSTSNDFTTKTGTSQAAPYISSISAMLRLIHPEIEPLEIENRIKAGAVKYDNKLIPILNNMIPGDEKIRLKTIYLQAGEKLALPVMASPETACEKMAYYSSNEDVVVVENDCIIALRTGNAMITVSCTGFDDMEFSVLVEDEEDTLILPEALTTIEDDSFMGIKEPKKIIIPENVRSIGDNNFTESCSLVYLPDSVMEIGDNCFANSILVCSYGSYPATFAKQKGLQYIFIN